MMRLTMFVAISLIGANTALGQTYLKAVPRASDPVVTNKGVAGQTPFFIDLQPVANLPLNGPMNNPNYTANTLEGLPRGIFKTEGGIPFQVGEKLVALKGRLAPGRPANVKIELNQTCSALYLLQGSCWGGRGRPDGPIFAYEKDTSAIGMYVITYEDDDIEFIPVVYGKDVRDWWGLWDNFQPTKNSEVVWRGTNEFVKKREEAKNEPKPLRLYMTTWKNPWPTLKIKTIEFLSEGSVAAPFCVAITGYSATEAQKVAPAVLKK